MGEQTRLSLAIGLAAIKIRGEFENVRLQEERAEQGIMALREEAGPKVVATLEGIFQTHGQDEIKAAFKGDDLGKAKERTPQQKNVANFRSAAKVIWDAYLSGWMSKEEMRNKFLYTQDGKARGFQNVVKQIREYRDSIREANRTDDATQQIAREAMRRMGIEDTVSLFQLNDEQHEAVMEAVQVGLAKAKEEAEEMQAAGNTPEAKAEEAAKRHYKANGLDWCITFAQAYAQAVTMLREAEEANRAAKAAAESAEPDADQDMPPVEMTERKAAA